MNNIKKFKSEKKTYVRIKLIQSYIIFLDVFKCCILNGGRKSTEKKLQAVKFKTNS